MNGPDQLAAASDQLRARARANDPLTITEMTELAGDLLRAARAWQRDPNACRAPITAGSRQLRLVLDMENVIPFQRRRPTRLIPIAPEPPPKSAA